MKKIGLLALVYILMTSSSSFAQNYSCSDLLTCDDLGYSFNATECDGLPILRCPFDYDKLYCKILLSRDCEVGHIYNSGKKKCLLKNTGDYVVAFTNKASQSCVGFLANTVLLKRGYLLIQL